MIYAEIIVWAWAGIALALALYTAYRTCAGGWDSICPEPPGVSFVVWFALWPVTMPIEIATRIGAWRKRKKSRG